MFAVKERGRRGEEERVSPGVRLRGVQLELTRNDGTVFQLGALGFEIVPGSIALVSGPNGSGKSTVLELIAGLRRPDAGEIHLNGTDMTCLNDKAVTRIRRDCVGLVRQKPLLLDFLSVRENVRVAMAVKKAVGADRIDSVLEDFGLKNLAAACPPHLSAGQQVLAALAQVFACRPPILLLDEPTANLDRRFSGVFWQYARWACDQGATAIIASHDADEREHADAVLTLEEGKLVNGPGTGPNA